MHFYYFIYMKKKTTCFCHDTMPQKPAFTQRIKKSFFGEKKKIQKEKKRMFEMTNPLAWFNTIKLSLD